MARPRTSTAEYVRPEQRLPAMKLYSAIPLPPQHPPLGPEGRRRWDWYCQMLINNNRLAEPFLVAIEEACRLHDELFAMRKELNRAVTDTKGKALVTFTKTSRKPNPLITCIQSHSKLLSALQDKLGCSPAAARNHNLPVNLPSDDIPKPGKSSATRPDNVDEFDFE